MYVHSLQPAADAKEILKAYKGNKEQAQKSRDGFSYRAALARKQSRQKKAIVLGVSGAASLATGLVLFYTLPPKTKASPQLSIAPLFGTDGGGFSLVGHF